MAGSFAIQQSKNDSSAILRSGKRFVILADEKLTAFVEFESAAQRYGYCFFAKLQAIAIQKKLMKNAISVARAIASFRYIRNAKKLRPQRVAPMPENMFPCNSNALDNCLLSVLRRGKRGRAVKASAMQFKSSATLAKGFGSWLSVSGELVNSVMNLPNR